VDWIPWGDVREIRTRPARQPGPAYAALEIRLAGGRRLALSRSLANLEALVQYVKRGVYPLLHESLRAEFNRGRELEFGPLRVTSGGVQSGKKTIAWADLGSVDVQAGNLVVTSRDPSGDRLRVAAARVPNIDVCVQIIRLLGQAS
jgi:hypothetical protein